MSQELATRAQVDCVRRAVQLLRHCGGRRLRMSWAPVQLGVLQAQPLELPSHAEAVGGEAVSSCHQSGGRRVIDPTSDTKVTAGRSVGAHVLRSSVEGRHRGSDT